MSKSRIAWTALLALLTLVRISLAAQPAADASTHDRRIQIEHAADRFVTTIRIRAEQGRVAWIDVLRGMARARGFDDEALASVFPSRDFAVTGTRSALIRGGLNLALGSKVHFSVERPGDEVWLVVRLDRAALLASQRRFKALLRDAILPTSSDDGQGKFGLKLDDDWEDAAAGTPVVIFIHGLNRRPNDFEGFLAAARGAGFGCGVFSYPNDQPIVDSARLLAGELSNFAEQHPGRQVALVTHSMGGLVARAAIEYPERNPGAVRRLIMLAPPNHGSTLAHFAFGIDLWEHLGDPKRREDTGKFYAMIEDGLSEASRDLIPDSPFLRELNAIGRNPRVRYTILLGTDAPFSEVEMAEFRRISAQAGRRNRWARFFGARFEALLDDCDEVVDGLGDGAVSVERGRLEGVEDVVVLHFSHANILDTSPRGDAKKAHQEVLARLENTD